MIPVLGMHRSGTSALAGALHKLGADLGPENSWIPAANDNPLGFFEYAPVVRVNRMILAAFGGTWSSPPALPRGWTGDERMAQARAAATELAEEAPPGLVVKDPRLSLLMPFWDEIIEPRPAVHCLRNPMAVARSLERRNGFSIDSGLMLWFRYSSAARLGRPEALMIEYEQLLAEPAEQLAVVASQIGHACSDRTIALAAETVRGDMAHESAEPTPASPIGELCTDLYDSLRQNTFDQPDQTERVARLVTEWPWAGPADRELRIAASEAQQLRSQLDRLTTELASAQARTRRLENDLHSVALDRDRLVLEATTGRLGDTEEVR